MIDASCSLEILKSHFLYNTSEYMRKVNKPTILKLARKKCYRCKQSEQKIARHLRYIKIKCVWLHTYILLSSGVSDSLGLSQKMFIFIFYFHFYHRACRYGNKKATHILLDKGATPSVRNAKGITPLHMACQFNHFDIAKV